MCVCVCMYVCVCVCVYTHVYIFKSVSSFHLIPQLIVFFVTHLLNSYHVHAGSTYYLTSEHSHEKSKY